MFQAVPLFLDSPDHLSLLGLLVLLANILDL